LGSSADPNDDLMIPIDSMTPDQKKRVNEIQRLQLGRYANNPIEFRVIHNDWINQRKTAKETGDYDQKMREFDLKTKEADTSHSIYRQQLDKMMMDPKYQAEVAKAQLATGTVQPKIDTATANAAVATGTQPARIERPTLQNQLTQSQIAAAAAALPGKQADSDYKTQTLPARVDFTKLAPTLRQGQIEGNQTRTDIARAAAPGNIARTTAETSNTLSTMKARDARPQPQTAGQASTRKDLEKQRQDARLIIEQYTYPATINVGEEYTDDKGNVHKALPDEVKRWRITLDNAQQQLTNAQAQLDAMPETGAPGAAPAGAKSAPGTGGEASPDVTPDNDKAALEWAAAHPDDPRAAEIRKRNGL
jgi:hypothetical protein